MVKNQTTKVKKKAGRPTKRVAKNKKISQSLSKLTPDAIQKLKQVFSFDASVEEICCYLEISIQTFYNWKKKNVKLFEELLLLRERPVLAIRQKVVEHAKESYNNGMDYLTRKKKIEFGGNAPGTININFSEEADKRAKKYEE